MYLLWLTVEDTVFPLSGCFIRRKSWHPVGTPLPLGCLLQYADAKQTEPSTPVGRHVRSPAAAHGQHETRLKSCSVYRSDSHGGRGFGDRYLYIGWLNLHSKTCVFGPESVVEYTIDTTKGPFR